MIVPIWLCVILIILGVAAGCGLGVVIGSILADIFY